MVIFYILECAKHIRITQNRDLHVAKLVSSFKSHKLMGKALAMMNYIFGAIL